MKLSNYQKTMQHICAPSGTKARILQACTTENTRSIRVPRFVPAATLALVLIAAICFSGRPNQPIDVSSDQEAGRTTEQAADASDGLLSDFPFSLTVFAADADGVDLIGSGGFEYGGDDFFIIENGILDRGSTLFFQLGGTGETASVDHVELTAETGMLTCYYQFENRNAEWDSGSILVPYATYERAVSDLENPTKEEIRNMLLRIEAGEEGSEDFHSATHLYINHITGAMEKELLPLLDKVEIQEVRFQTKMDISTVIIDFRNPESTAKKKEINVKSLSVRPFEEVQWSPDVEALRGTPAENIDFSNYSDCLHVTAYKKDGTAITGEIHIEFSPDGVLKTYFEIIK